MEGLGMMKELLEGLTGAGMAEFLGKNKAVMKIPSVITAEAQLIGKEAETGHLNKVIHLLHGEFRQAKFDHAKKAQALRKVIARGEKRNAKMREAHERNITKARQQRDHHAGTVIAIRELLAQRVPSITERTKRKDIIDILTDLAAILAENKAPCKAAVSASE